mgnify:FL=1
MLYVFAWKNNPKRAAMHNRRCRVLARGSLNSCLIEFTDNSQREIISRNALRKQNPSAPNHRQTHLPFHV